MRTVKKRILPFMMAVILLITMFVFSPPVKAAGTTAGTYTALKDAIDSAPNGVEYIIEITDNINFGTSGTITIASGKNIVIQSNSTGGPYKLTQNQSLKRHFAVDGSLTLKDIILDGSTNNTPATASGGGVSTSSPASSGKIYVQDGAVIRNCYADRGGGVFIQGATGALTMTGGEISGNKVVVAGGGIYGYRIDISGKAVISNNGATAVGGGIYGALGAQVTISGKVEISDNVVTAQTPQASNNTTACGGGVAIDNGGTLTMRDEAFIKNCRALNGGGVALISRSGNNSPIQFTMSDSVAITDCNANEDGGGMYAYFGQSGACTFTMDGGTISGNEAAENGGGICGDTKSTINISSGEISKNTAIIGGGVYKTGTGALNMTGGTISTNKATSSAVDSYGGGVYLHGSSFVMGKSGDSDDSVIIEGNKAGYMGGGVGVHYGSKFTMKSGTIRGNQSVSGDNLTYGGGVEVYDKSTFDMENGFITGNSSTDYSGGVEVYNQSTFNMKNGIISNNTSSHGGGVSVGFKNAAFNMIGGTISGNKATSYGGGVYAYSNGSMDVTTGTIMGNSAPYGGGVFTNTTSKVNIVQCAITNNTASNGGGGIYTMDKTYSNLITGRSTKFSSNAATSLEQPEGDLDLLYPRLEYTSVSVTQHPLNNYDINTTFDAPVNCHITFDVKGVADQVKDFGETVEKPDDPTRIGYEFKGWFTKDENDDLKEEWDFTTELDEAAHGLELVLFAKWEVKDVIVGGTVSGLEDNSGIAIQYSIDGGDTIKTTFTDAGGVYKITVLYESNLIITPPGQTGYNVDPASRNVTVTEEYLTGNDFIYTKKDYIVYLSFDGDYDWNDFGGNVAVTFWSGSSRQTAIFSADLLKYTGYPEDGDMNGIAIPSEGEWAVNVSLPGGYTYEVYKNDEQIETLTIDSADAENCSIEIKIYKTPEEWPWGKQIYK